MLCTNDVIFDISVTKALQLRCANFNNKTNINSNISVARNKWCVNYPPATTIELLTAASWMLMIQSMLEQVWCERPTARWRHSNHSDLASQMDIHNTTLLSLHSVLMNVLIVTHIDVPTDISSTLRCLYEISQ